MSGIIVHKENSTTARTTNLSLSFIITFPVDHLVEKPTPVLAGVSYEEAAHRFVEYGFSWFDHTRRRLRHQGECSLWKVGLDFFSAYSYTFFFAEAWHSAPLCLPYILLAVRSGPCGVYSSRIARRSWTESDGKMATGSTEPKSAPPQVVDVAWTGQNWNLPSQILGTWGGTKKLARPFVWRGSVHFTNLLTLPCPDTRFQEAQPGVAGQRNTCHLHRFEVLSKCVRDAKGREPLWGHVKRHHVLFLTCTAHLPPWLSCKVITNRTTRPCSSFLLDFPDYLDFTLCYKRFGRVHVERNVQGHKKFGEWLSVHWCKVFRNCKVVKWHKEFRDWILEYSRQQNKGVGTELDKLGF